MRRRPAGKVLPGVCRLRRRSMQLAGETPHDISGTPGTSLLGSTSPARTPKRRVVDGASTAPRLAGKSTASEVQQNRQGQDDRLTRSERSGQQASGAARQEAAGPRRSAWGPLLSETGDEMSRDKKNAGRGTDGGGSSGLMRGFETVEGPQADGSHTRDQECPLQRRHLANPKISGTGGLRLGCKASA